MHRPAASYFPDLSLLLVSVHGEGSLSGAEVAGGNELDEIRCGAAQ